MTPDQLRILAAIQGAIREHTAESLAAAHGWDLRLTLADVRELRRRGLVHRDGSVVLRPGVTVEDLPAEDDVARFVVMALRDGHRTVAEIVGSLGAHGTPRMAGRVRAAVRRMVRAGLVWPLRRLVAR